MEKLKRIQKVKTIVKKSQLQLIMTQSQRVLSSVHQSVLPLHNPVMLQLFHIMNPISNIHRLHYKWMGSLVTLFFTRQIFSILSEPQLLKSLLNDSQKKKKKDIKFIFLSTSS